VNSSPAVEVTGASLAYRLSRSTGGTFKEYMLNMVRRQVRYEQFWAVTDVSLIVEPGEVLGVIGPNGAGKTTLMRLIAGVLQPNHGRVVTRGVVAPLIALGAGFNPELTAHENAVVYGALLGRDPDEMERRVPRIIEWAGLDGFTDVPLRNYSSGMSARLGFAVATDIDPRVLVVDEVLAVGDAAFRNRSRDRMLELITGGAAVVLVSHQMGIMRRTAHRVLWLDRGRVKMVGEPDEVIAAYEATT
jgi:ABC-type polysaccharide/polyol phosphate transport system ATPase subunit